MSTNDPKPRKHKQKEAKSQPANGAERLKTVVRRLPPNLPEDVFWQSVQAWVTDDTVTWKSYHPGKLRTKRVVNKEGTPSRAYIAFKTEALVATFSRAYDGHIFRDKAGNESHAVVEYAPFQKTPAEKKKTDARNNTIDKDDDYLSFLHTLKGESKPESVSLEALVAASQPPPPPTTTPLLEALKAEKSAQKDKEAILRNHAHYKDAAGVSGSASKREENKKRMVAAAAVHHPHPHPHPHPHQQQQQQQSKTESHLQSPPGPPVSAVPMGKKAKKAATGAVQVQEGKGGGPGVHGALPPPPTNVRSAPAPARHRPPKEPLHGRPHLPQGKGDVLASAPGPVQQLPPPPPPPAVTTEAAASSPVHAQGQAQGPIRKSRPVIGLGRHFEAALSGAGVVVAAPQQQGGGAGPSDRTRRDKGSEIGAGAGAGRATTETVVPGSVSGSGKGKQKHREQRSSSRPSPPVEVVPSILQRPAEASAGSGAEVVIMQRPQSTEGHGDGAGVVVNPPFGPGAGPGGRGPFPRRGRGRGRGVHRGG